MGLGLGLRLGLGLGLGLGLASQLHLREARVHGQGYQSATVPERRVVVQRLGELHAPAVVHPRHLVRGWGWGWG